MSSCKLKRHVRQDCSDPERSKGTERMRKRTWEIRKRLIALGVLDDREADADESQRKGARDGAHYLLWIERHRCPSIVKYAH